MSKQLPSGKDKYQLKGLKANMAFITPKHFHKKATSEEMAHAFDANAL
jgi:hypothetical protein